MARPRASRKGKKEWRRNISTTEHEAHLVRAGKDERSGGPLDSVPSDNIFFVDKSKRPAVRVRKVDKARARILHSDSILQRASLVPPVPWPAPRRAKAPAASIGSAKAQSGDARDGGSMGPSRSGSGALAGSAAASLPRHKGSGPLKDLWPDEDLGGLRSGEVKSSKRRRLGAGVQASLVPAVEVDLPGCSYNPTFEDHQDALAVAVAAEVIKEAKKELEPTGPPLEVVRGRATVAEMYAGFEGLIPEVEEGAEAGIEAGAGAGGATAGVAGPEAGGVERGTEDAEGAEGETQEESAAPPPAPPRPVRVNKLTRADLNRKIRRREQEAVLDAKRRRKQLMRDAARAQEIATELDDEEEEAGRRRLRKEVSRKERRLEAPPRLGKHRFEAEPVSVMLSEELTGSLRQVKGCFTLARDRFKSLQKRGILEPRVPVRRKAAKRRRIVEVGSKGQKEREMHAEILQMRAARQGKADVLSLH